MSGLKERWPRWEWFLDGLARDLARIRRRAPFSHVTRARVSAAGLNAVAAHPLYARAWRNTWRALRSGVQGDAQADPLPISPSWEIYERWCYWRLPEALREMLPGWSWRATAGGSWSALCCWAGRGPAGERLRWFLQPVFSCSSGDVREGPWSVSRKRVPDMVLLRETTEGTDFIVLDAKYRASRRNVLDAMASAHIYQDALRIGSSRPRASLLLVPAAGGAPWLEQPGFQHTHRVGVARLGPGNGPEPWLREYLSMWIQAPSKD